ncbi:hypothetical protein GQ457_12G028380 [Hibiscus cannabinus]
MADRARVLIKRGEGRSQNQKNSQFRNAKRWNLLLLLLLWIWIAERTVLNVQNWEVGIIKSQMKKPRISGWRADRIISALGFPYSHRVEALGFSGGIWLAWYDTVRVDILCNHFQYIHCRITSASDNRSSLATMVYASPNARKRQALWSALRNLAQSIFCPWFIVGDFNATLFYSDRQGCAVSAKPSKAFRDFVFDHGLRDMGFSGPDFTWSRGMAHVRLDRFLCNSYWDETFPESIVNILLRRLRFGMTLFGYIGTKKRILMARLRGIHKALCTRRSHFLVSLENSLLLELEGLLDQEELIWRQKSRSEWITHGDRNTTYFHRRAINRRQKSRIRALKLNNGEWITDDSTLKLEAVHFFSHLFSMEHNVPASFNTRATFQDSLDATNHVSFGSVLTANGDWDVAKLAQIFTEDALPYIIGVKSPSPQGGSDRCIWRWTNHHGFELKSAYDRCSPLILEETDPIWNQIWTLQVPQRIRCFLWLASRQKLMTNLHRCRRTLSDDPYCPICQEAEESIIHTFRDCERLQQVWRYIIPSSLAASFFSNPIKVWLRQNLCSNILFRNSIPWKIVFAAILWQFWKCRNDVVFVGDSASVECALSRGIAWAQYYNDGWLHPMQTVHAPPRTIPWQNPKHGCLCLNVDGAVSLNTGKVTIGGLLRDTAGNFIFGFSKYIGFTNSLHAELWALYVGLQLAWDHGVNFLQIQTDCNHCNRVLELLHDTNVDSCPISLVRSIHQFWRHAWYVDLIWVPRSSNQAADSMARIANCSSFDLLFFSDPPAQLHDVLTTDALVLSS